MAGGDDEGMSDEPITEAELVEIEARCRAATPGPWLAGDCDEYDPSHVHDISSPGEYGDIVQTDSGVYPPKKADAAFICHARMDIPLLVAEVRRLRSLLLRAYDHLPKDTPRELREEVEKEF